MSTVTYTSPVGYQFQIGAIVFVSDLVFANFLNGQFVTVTSVTSNTFTGAISAHAAYGTANGYRHGDPVDVFNDVDAHRWYWRGVLDGSFDQHTTNTIEHFTDERQHSDAPGLPRSRLRGQSDDDGGGNHGDGCGDA